MTMKDRIRNHYLINFVDHKSKYFRVILSRTVDAAAKKVGNSLVLIEKLFECRIHVARTNGGGEYANVGLVCKKTGVA